MFNVDICLPVLCIINCCPPGIWYPCCPCLCQHSALSPVFTYIFHLIYPSPSSSPPFLLSQQRNTRVKIVSRFRHHSGCEKSFKNSILRLLLHNTKNPISCWVSRLPSTKYITVLCNISLRSFHSSWLDLWYL